MTACESVECEHLRFPVTYWLHVDLTRIASIRGGGHVDDSSPTVLERPHDAPSEGKEQHHIDPDDGSGHVSTQGLPNAPSLMSRRCVTRAYGSTSDTTTLVAAPRPAGVLLRRGAALTGRPRTSLLPRRPPGSRPRRFTTSTFRILRRSRRVQDGARRPGRRCRSVGHDGPAEQTAVALRPGAPVFPLREALREGEGPVISGTRAHPSRGRRSSARAADRWWRRRRGGRRRSPRRPWATTAPAAHRSRRTGPSTAAP